VFFNRWPNGLRYLRVGGVDFVWEQEKLEARKMLENAAESHTSGARFVSLLLTLEDLFALRT
jgi:hypothetical protein